ncbi:MAG: hypothetical protein HOJ35_05980 [Bdellovibrionales bacterium]|nr:hypothetical protein [Bdellovibrionales bacterium]
MKINKKNIIYPMLSATIIIVSLSLYLNFISGPIQEESFSNFDHKAESSDNIFSALNQDNCGQEVNQVQNGHYMPIDFESKKVVFRYRTYEGVKPSWVSKGDTNLVLYDGENITKYDRGEFFDDLFVTDFDTNYYLGDNKIDIGSSLTIQAWFQTSSKKSYQTLFSNTEGGGFSLKVKNGKLRGLFRINSSSASYSSLILYGDSAVNNGKWHHAAFTVQRNTSRNEYRLCLYLDGKTDGCKVFNRSQSARKSNFRPSVGAEPNENHGRYTFEDYFRGKIYAVTVHDYLIKANFFKGRTVRDGSRYFNTPSYHDYINSKYSNDIRFKNTLLSKTFKFTKNIQERFSLPFLDDYYIPQGISIEGGSIYVSYYYNARHKDGDCDEENPDNYPSIIVEIDRCASKLKNVYALYKDDFHTPNTSHVGGVAVVKKGGSTYAFIPSKDGLHRYDLNSPDSTIISSSPPPKSLMNTKGTIKKILYSDSFNYSSLCGYSYVSYDKYRNLLWVGGFDEDSLTNICSYKLNSAKNSLSEWSSINQLPVNKVQGAVARPDGKLLLSTSYGHKKSRIYLWDIDNASFATTVKTLLYGNVLKGPPGFEDVTISSDGMLFGLSESGGAYYQKRGNNNKCSSSWTGFYPYIFGIDINDLD